MKYFSDFNINVALEVKKKTRKNYLENDSTVIGKSKRLLAKIYKPEKFGGNRKSMNG
jgi:hypothetical protein